MPEPRSRFEGARRPAATEPGDGTWPDRPRRRHRWSLGLRRNLLLQLRHDGPSAPEDLAAGLGASRTGVLQQLHALEAAGLVSREGRSPRCRPAAPRVRRHRRRPGPLPDQLRRPRRWPARGDPGDRRRGAGRRRVRGAAAADERRVRQRLADRLPADAPLVDRARELAVIQDEQGYLAEAADRRRRGDPPGRAQLRDPPRRRRQRGGLPGGAGPVPRRPRRRRRARDAHRGRRPLLHVPDRE